MNATTRPRMRRQSRYELSRTSAFFATFLASLLAAPANAGITLPNDPLMTGSRVPPNIMFILDNSGSMALVSMPTLPTNTDNDVQPAGYSGTATGADRTGLRDSPLDRSYLNNAVYYNPSITYNPWMNADGVSRMTGGTTAGAAYKDWNLASGDTRDLRGDDESIFYVPKTGVVASVSPSPADYDRYSISSAGVVGRDAMASPSASPSLPAGPYSSSGSGVAATINITVPSGANSLRVFTSGGNNRVELRLARPDGANACTSNSGNGSESCAVSSPVAGVWTATLRRDGSGSGANFSGVTVDATVGTFVPALPNPVRTQAQELANIATWYSYYRTRLKTAKAGASEAFGGLSREMRVGYTPINGRSSHLSASGTDEIIPVNTKDGRFENPNKSNWFTAMQNAAVQDGSTPLRTALNAVGAYYTRSDANGPWGPQATSSQLACRQSFSILTTDGYWNDGGKNGFDGSHIGNSDGDANNVTLADVAMHYWKTDLRSGLANIVPKTDADPADWQHMVTFGLSIGLQGSMAITDPPPASNSSAWTNPMDAEDAHRIDDLWHAAVNSRGKFVAASDPMAFSNGLQAALSEITKRNGSFSNVAANSTSLDAGTRVFQAKYVAGVWTGELDAYAATSSKVATTPSWSASVGIPVSNRKVFTSNGSTGLQFPSQATSGQLAALARPVFYPVTGAQNAAYIVGDRSGEIKQGGVLRNRNSLFGDIVSSSPAYVKDTDTVYVGANDGMLHAINAANGQELFTYIPNIIDWSGLSTLSRPDYTHRYLVDGPVVVSSRKQTPGKNILVGTLGKGGKGLFALDVSNPGSFGASGFLWEDAETPGNNMGLVQGRPIIAKLNNGVTALVVSNGINSTSERAVLLVYNLQTGSLIAEIDTGAGSSSAPNGLSAPVGWDRDGNGTLDHVYAGDMLGNVWKFDLTASTSASWGVANLGNPLFTATGPGGVVQPISSGLTVAMHPTTYKTWVFFGTGRFMTTDDVTNQAVQSLYGFVDDGASIVRDGAGANLTKRNVVFVGTASDGRPVRAFEGQSALPLNSKGWYIDLVPPSPAAAEGERIVSDAQVVGDVLITSSIAPSKDPCKTDGKGYLNALNAFTGTSGKVSFFDLDGDGSFADETVGQNNLPIGSVDLGVGMPTLPGLLRGLAVVGGSSGGVGSVRTNESRNVGRVSWREVIRD